MKNPYDLTPQQFEEEIRTVVRGATTPTQAKEWLRKHFSPRPHFIVQKRGNHHFGVLAQQCIGAENVAIICQI